MSDSFPFKWINKKWKEGFYVTSMATSHTRWAVVMSRNAGFVDQARTGQPVPLGAKGARGSAAVGSTLARGDGV